MKRLLLPLLAALLSPIAAKAEPIPKISDWDASFEQPFKMWFKCPYETVSKVEDGKFESKKIPLYPKCWVTFHKDYMEIMGRQKIDRKDVIEYWHQIKGSNVMKGGSFHHFIYKDISGNKKLFSPKTLVGKWSKHGEDYFKNQYVRHLVEVTKNNKMSQLNIEKDVINHWMAQ
tara:strand:+ start:39 stop:557 length:519 start_codon:yes stop_codon:yes gene_type:complete